MRNDSLADAGTAAGVDRSAPTPLHAQGITRDYGHGARRVEALRGVDISVPAGNLLMIRGRSGSGKTTLLNILGGLDRPTTGTVTVAGLDLAALSTRRRILLRRKEIGFVFQSFGLIPYLTAAENAGLPLRIRRDHATDREDLVARALEAVGLTAQAEQRPAEMSGGQQQRVAIARALVQRPRVLIADEPTGHLDSRTGESILALLRKVAHDHRTAIVVSSHDKRLVDYADSVLHLRDGRFVEPEAVG